LRSTPGTRVVSVGLVDEFKIEVIERVSFECLGRFSLSEKARSSLSSV
jgi:hypothetical protein